MKVNKEHLFKNIISLIKKYGAKKIAVFGSYARGEEKPKSDIDILVEFSESPDFFEFIKLEDYLEKLLGIKVDLVTRDALKPLIRQEILKEVIYI